MPSATISAIAFLMSACAGTPSVELANTQKDDSSMQAPADSVMVMALYPDADEQTRVVIENAVVDAFRRMGIDATAGFRLTESYKSLGGREEEIKQIMVAHGLDAIVMVDPIRVKDFDPAAYDARRAAYRAWGMNTSAAFNMIGRLAAEADSAKAEIDVLLWDRRSENFVWHAEYDLNAPGSYEMEVAQQYASEFGKLVATKLKDEGLVR